MNFTIEAIVEDGFPSMARCGSLITTDRRGGADSDEAIEKILIDPASEFHRSAFHRSEDRKPGGKKP
jgi:hypothetical protein